MVPRSRRAWSDPSSPVQPPDSPPFTAPGDIAGGFTRYYAPLFASKPSLPVEREICFKALREGDRVQPPTALKCGAAITTQVVYATCLAVPLGKSPGPDALPNKFYC
jgi:hypothetical protein